MPVSVSIICSRCIETAGLIDLVLVWRLPSTVDAQCGKLVVGDSARCVGGRDHGNVQVLGALGLRVRVPHGPEQVVCGRRRGHLQRDRRAHQGLRLHRL